MFILALKLESSGDELNWLMTTISSVCTQNHEILWWSFSTCYYVRILELNVTSPPQPIHVVMKFLLSKLPMFFFMQSMDQISLLHSSLDKNHIFFSPT